ncbi:MULTISPECIES: hypothetical protein [Pseudarthrobacter]|uniref:Uncharacterized protein n=1 Tax=Pseudarthrobacter polychromogenes TaxID=1676 RepID=A0ABQ1XPW6_9MICC|nr:hypothetical protein [Pseudarthrobacter polychromogenes]GGG99676.1 hypothetical protein GCM10011577_24030 [Pseudarthrobacter polychromogenes]
MGDNERLGQSRRFRRWVIAAVVVLLPALFLTHVALFNRWYLSPGNAVEAFEYQPNLPVTNARDVTSEVCSAQVSCRAAIVADEIAVYQFWTRGAAQEYARTLGEDGYQSDWLVLRYEDAGKMTNSDMSYGSLIDAMWTSD